MRSRSSRASRLAAASAAGASWHSLAGVIHQAQLILRLRMATARRQRIPFQRATIALRDTLPEWYTRPR